MYLLHDQVIVGFVNEFWTPSGSNPQFEVIFTRGLIGLVFFLNFV